jgi:hypothetical protein
MIALHRGDKQIWVRDSDTKQESAFDSKTGAKLWGNLDMNPEEVLYCAWAQTQSVNLSERQLRDRYRELTR